MQIKTTKPNLLILDRCYPEGSAVEVLDPIGKRLIERGAAVPFVAVPQELETATLPAPPSRATKRA